MTSSNSSSSLSVFPSSDRGRGKRLNFMDMQEKAKGKRDERIEVAIYSGKRFNSRPCSILPFVQVLLSLPQSDTEHFTPSDQPKLIPTVPDSHSLSLQSPVVKQPASIDRYRSNLLPNGTRTGPNSLYTIVLPFPPPVMDACKRPDTPYPDTG